MIQVQLLLPSLGLKPCRRWLISHSFKGFRQISATAKMSTESYAFGSYSISCREVFYTTPLSFAFVNLRPVVPGIKDSSFPFCIINFLALGFPQKKKKFFFLLWGCLNLRTLSFSLTLQSVFS
ncbi:hypothetical protein SLEP1_g21041 [Rubroshorea leprosula]|uniref:Uncharacterized protein n=2 Tax=Rubroshorea leprosula TaxID=152421 RepID=A0AAV5JDF7_9ROSI|nr:hypothetical protein SLEP1_g21041 [Rubroshorea leprosula]